MRQWEKKTEQQQKIEQTKHNLSDFWDNIKQSNICAIGVLTEKESGRQKNKLMKSWVKTFIIWQKLQTYSWNELSKLHARETKQQKNEKNTSRYIITKLLKTISKEKLSKATVGGKGIWHIDTNHTLETIRSRRWWDNILKVLKEKKLI